MARKQQNLIPLKPYLLGGHLAFVVTLLVMPLVLISPFLGLPYLSIEYERHWRTLIPEWISLVLQGHERFALTAIIAAYPVCVGGALAVWAIQERHARRYVRERRG